MTDKGGEKKMKNYSIQFLDDCILKISGCTVSPEFYVEFKEILKNRAENCCSECKALTIVFDETVKSTSSLVLGLLVGYAHKHRNLNLGVIIHNNELYQIFRNVNAEKFFDIVKA